MFTKSVGNPKSANLTLNDVPQALRIQEVLQARHFLLQLTHQPVVGVFIDDSITADLFGAVSVPVRGESKGLHAGGKTGSS